MTTTLKWYENLNQTHEFFSPAVDVAKDGIVTVSNLKQLRIGSLIKFKTDNEDYGLVSTLNLNGTAEILVLTNNEVFQGSQIWKKIFMNLKVVENLITINKEINSCVILVEKLKNNKKKNELRQ